MSYSRVSYVANGATVNYTVTFPYILEDHVKVYVNDVLQVVTTDYTWLNSTTIHFVTAPANGLAIVLKRASSPSTRLVDYQDGSTLTEALLDSDANQLFYISQEAVDEAADGIRTSLVSLQWDADTLRVTNVVDPVNAQDAATKNYVDTRLATDVTATAASATAAATSATASAASATAAAASAASASTSATTATTQASAASTSATAAATSATAAAASAASAATSATTATTQATSATASATSATTSAATATTQATNAATSATSATASATAAATSATNAATSETNAATSATNASADAIYIAAQLALVAGSIVFPLDCGLITDAVVSYTYDLGTVP